MLVTEKKLQNIRNEVIDAVLSGLMYLTPIAVATMVFRVSIIGWLPVHALSLLLALSIFAIALFRRRLNLKTKSFGLIGILMLVGTAIFLQHGLLSFGPLYFLTSIGLATIFFSKRGVIVTIVSTVLATTGVGLFIVSSGFLPQYDVLTYLLSPVAWLSTVTYVSILGIVFFHALARYNALLLDALTEAISSAAFAKQAQKAALVAMADLAESKDSDTGEHVLRVARMTHEIARTLLQQGIKPDSDADGFLENIGIASILHDVGKVGIPDSVLLKPGKLTPEERKVMENHPQYGGGILEKATRMLADSPQFKLASEIAASHHEHWDGAGYPNGLRGTDIPLSARIVAIADVYDALTSKRPYKEPWSTEKALGYIRERRGHQFDPAVVDAFFAVLAIRGQATSVEWSDEIAIGHPMIDQDHRILLELINQINNPENAKDMAAVRFVLDELVNYTHFHFKREEDLMVKAGYPDLEQHQEVHAKMIDVLKALQQRFDQQSESIGSELSEFLNGWLVSHIMHTDKAYCPYVLAHTC